MFAIAWMMLVAQVSAQHAFSASDALVTIDRRSVRFIVRLPLDEVDLLLRLDRDLDGDVSATELVAARPAILAYPKFSDNAEVRLSLAVDYRDLSRKYRDAGDPVNATRYQRLSRAECERILRVYPGSEQAAAARQILQSSR